METSTKITGFIIVAFIIIALLTAVITNVETGQKLVDVNNETITMTDNVTGTFSIADIQNVATLINGSIGGNDVSGICNVTLSTGDIVCDNLFSSDNFLLSNYTYYPTTYVKERSSRTLIILISLILVIAVIVAFIRNFMKTK